MVSRYTRVKICGNTCADDVDMAVQYGADAVGFIVDVPVDTHRKISADVAHKLVAAVPIFVDSVLVIMPDSAESALSLIGTVIPDIVQIHNDLDIDVLSTIKEESDIPLIKTISMPSSMGMCATSTTNIINTTDGKDIVNRTLAYIASISHIANAVLLDTKTKALAGGTGIVHDWGISSAIASNSSLPVILAGGLNPDNVASSVLDVSPYGVDTASGVETERKKDREKVRCFIDQSRR